MKFNIVKEKFISVIQDVVYNAPTKPINPITGNVLIRAINNNLILITNNLQTEIQSIVECDILKEGETTISAHKLYDIVKELPNATKISFVEQTGKVIIKTEKNKYQINTIDAADFPVFSENEVLKKIHLEQNILKTLINKVSYAAAVDDVRFFLKGVCLELSNKTIKTIATDGHRMAVFSIKDEISLDSILQFIIPNGAVISILKLFNEKKDVVELSAGKNHMEIRNETKRIKIKLIDGTYPDYLRIIPNSYTTKVVINKEHLISVIKQNISIQEDKAKLVKIEFSKEKSNIETENKSGEFSQSFFDLIEFEGENLTIGVNAVYLLDVLRITPEENVTIEMSGDDRAIKTVNEDTINIIMPARL